MTPLRPVGLTLVAGAVLLGAAPLAHAAFRDSAGATSSFTAAQLSAPTGLTASRRCTLSLLGIVLSASLDLTWTRSSSTWASGQTVVVTDGAGSTVATKTLDASATSTSVDLPLVSGGSYTASVHATYGSWTSATATATSGGC